MILVASRYENQFLSLNYVVNANVTQNFDSPKLKQNSTPGLLILKIAVLHWSEISATSSSDWALPSFDWIQNLEALLDMIFMLLRTVNEPSYCSTGIPIILAGTLPLMFTRLLMQELLDIKTHSCPGPFATGIGFLAPRPHLQWLHHATYF